MSENLNKKPRKGILKQSSSFDKASTSARSTSKFETSESTEAYGSNRKSTKFDEMNIIETLHPPDKDYGHMKIEEPKTPFNYYEDGEDGEIGGVSERRDEAASFDPVDLSNRLENSTDPHQAKPSAGGLSSGTSDEEEDIDLDPEELAKRQMFESKRKAHYNEYYAVKLARKLLEQEEDEDDNNEAGGGSGGELNSSFVPIEEVGNE